MPTSLSESVLINPTIIIGDRTRVMLRESSRQLVAATANESWFAKQAGTLKSVDFIADEVAGAGESMVVDILVNGASVLTGVYTYDSGSSPNTWYPASLDGAKLAVVKGDLISVSRVYTAGGSATPVAENEVVIEMGA